MVIIDEFRGFVILIFVFERSIRFVGWWLGYVLGVFWVKLIRIYVFVFGC